MTTTILRGKQILDKVRTKIGDARYSSYDEINEAHNWIARQAPFTWLRAKSTTTVALVADTDEYTLNLANARRVTAVRVAGADATATDPFTKMEEVSFELFEQYVQDSEDADINYINREVEDIPWKYTLFVGASGPFGKIRITPIPETTYQIRVDYIKDVTEILPDTIPTMPHAYMHTLINLAAGYILERDPQRYTLGMRYVNRAESTILNLVRDSQSNKTKDIDRKPQAWIK